VGKMPKRSMSTVLKKVSHDKVSFEISRDNFEAFCSAVGLFKPDFLKIMKKSEEDHKAGRVTKRKSLYELIKKP
jgi:hypothetical protein